MNTPSQNLTVLHDSKEWTTKLEGEIEEIRVDGRKLSDIHDLAFKIDKMTTVIKALALTATFLAVVAVAGIGAIGSWLASNKDQISSTMSTTEERFSKRIQVLENQSSAYAQKLTELGWTWKDGNWQQIGNSPVNHNR